MKHDCLGELCMLCCVSQSLLAAAHYIFYITPVVDISGTSESTLDSVSLAV